jgi:hypothetical protein
MAYRRSRRRYSTHTAAWTCRPEVYNRVLEEGDIVRLTFDRVASDGSTTTHDFLYQLDQIVKAPTGEIEFQATHFPIDATGRSVIALDVMSAQAQGHVYTTMRTGLDCDDDSAGDRATDTSVPASVGQAVAPGAAPAPPGDPPTLPPNPGLPGEPDKPPLPPGGYNPPSTPPAPSPTPPDQPPPPECYMDCRMRTLEGGTSLPCEPGETNVGFGIINNVEYTFCQSCTPPTGDCQQCSQAQLNAGARTVTYTTYQLQFYDPETPQFGWRDDGLRIQAINLGPKTGTPYVQPSDSGTSQFYYTNICGVYTFRNVGFGVQYTRLFPIGTYTTCVTSATCP